MDNEHALGTRFEVRHCIYEVRGGGSCCGCAFYIESENHCTSDYNEVGPCSKDYREDDHNVIFVKVGEATKG